MSKGNGTLHGYQVEIRDISFSASVPLYLPDGDLIGPDWQVVTFHESLNPAGVPVLASFDSLGSLSRDLMPFTSAQALAYTVLAQMRSHAYGLALRIVECRVEYTYERTRTGIVGDEIVDLNRHARTVHPGTVDGVDIAAHDSKELASESPESEDAGGKQVRRQI